jgi:hypothetical protein
VNDREWFTAEDAEREECRERLTAGEAMAEFDRSSKWLIQHHGDALLRLAGVQDIVAWRPLQAEVVQPAQLPDGLLEVRHRGERRPRRFVVEVATYPERRVEEQLVRDTLLVYLNYRVVPDALALVLRPKGRFRVPASATLPSEEGWSELNLRWRVVELWTVPVDALLTTEEPGLMPWAPLAQFAGPAAPVVRRCRTIIEQVSDAAERTNLLAVTQVLTRLRYNDPRLLQILGGERAMVESPLIREIVEDAESRTKAEDILRVLQYRFGPLPADVQDAVRATRDASRLEALLEGATRCPDLEAFRARLA